MLTMLPPNGKVTSFDLCGHAYTVPNSERTAAAFGKDRHTLICGDSRVTVPEYSAQHPKQVSANTCNMYVYAQVQYSSKKQ
jgi:hypothetical protein